MLIIASAADILITFLIGPALNPTKFLIHKEVACYAPPVFDTAFSSQFVEGQTHIYKLEDTTPRAFRFFVQWAYSREIKVLIEQEDEDLKAAMQAMTPPYYERDVVLGEDPFKLEGMALLEAWVLADKLVMPELQNVLIAQVDSLMLDYSRFHGVAFCLHYLYDNTTAGSPLRKIFVHRIVHHLRRKFDLASLIKDAEALPCQMLVDMLLWHDQISREETSETYVSVENYMV